MTEMRASAIARRRRRRLVMPVVASLIVSGCAAFELEPLATSHPAHPAAAAASEPPPSRTLAYTAADIPSPQPPPRVAGIPPDGLQPSAPRERTASTVVGEGEVVATVPKAGQIVVDHGAIEGFMDAMTMGYQVDPASLLAGLEPGDRVRFRIDVRRRAIVDIEKLP